VNTCLEMDITIKQSKGVKDENKHQEKNERNVIAGIK